MFAFRGQGMISGRDVLVIGAGIGGLAAAIALARRGARVRVVEQSPVISEVGAGLQITPNGVAVLDALGLGEALRAAAVVSRAVELRDYRAGRLVVRLDLARHARNGSYLLLHRADLVALLARAARDAGVGLLLDHAVAAVSDGETGASVTLADGREIAADLVVGADGLHSRLRPVLNGEAAPFFTGQVAWRALVPGAAGPAERVRVFMGPGRHLVAYPLRGGTLTNIVAVEEREAWAAEGWNHPGEVDELRRAFAMFCPEVAGLLRQVETVNLWGLFRHPVAARWHGRASAIVGDAAHPTLPFLAQGANMALEDAWVLADALDGAGLAQGLAAYQACRRDRVVRVIEAANANARNYHLRNPLLRGAAHAGLRLAGALAPGQVLERFSWVHDHDVTRES